MSKDDALCELLPWDSDFWHARVGRVRSEPLGRAELASVDAWSLGRAVDVVYYLAPGSDPAAAQAAEEAGFRFVDARVRLDRRAAPAQVDHIRPARSSDVAELRAIARTAHTDTRFYADPRFPDHRCDDLYETWIERSCEGWADAVLVAASAGEPSGYVTLHRGAPSEGSIGLIAVAEEARGRGIGRALVEAAVGWVNQDERELISVVTQGRNVRAQRLFQSCGFRTAAVDVWFHKWYTN